MKCKECASSGCAVIDSRECEMGTRRRRECQSCGYRWTTYEMTAEQWDRLAARKATAMRKRCMKIIGETLKRLSEEKP